MLSLDQLPESAQALAAVIGEHHALRLLQRLPGRSFEVPVQPKRLPAEITGNINQAAAAKLCRAYGNSTLYLPKCSKAARHVQYALIQQRFTIATTQAAVPARRAVANIATETGLCERQVWNILKVPLAMELATPPRRDDSQLALVL